LSPALSAPSMTWYAMRALPVRSWYSVGSASDTHTHGDDTHMEMRRFVLRWFRSLGLGPTPPSPAPSMACDNYPRYQSAPQQPAPHSPPPLPPRPPPLSNRASTECTGTWPSCSAHTSAHTRPCSVECCSCGVVPALSLVKRHMWRVRRVVVTCNVPSLSAPMLTGCQAPHVICHTHVTACHCHVSSSFSTHVNRQCS
jgi:hypothetical protein